jgi:hypothetical protein
MASRASPVRQCATPSGLCVAAGLAASCQRSARDRAFSRLNSHCVRPEPGVDGSPPRQLGGKGTASWPPGKKCGPPRCKSQCRASDLSSQAEKVTRTPLGARLGCKSSHRWYFAAAPGPSTASATSVRDFLAVPPRFSSTPCPPTRAFPFHFHFAQPGDRLWAHYTTAIGGSGLQDDAVCEFGLDSLPRSKRRVLFAERFNS